MTDTIEATITDFLLARIAEDEEMAREANTKQARTPYSDDSIPPVSPERWGALVEDYLGGEIGEHCARHSPLRIFRECEAKRRVVEWHAHEWTEGVRPPCHTLRFLAAVYADHPDYRQEWTL